MLIARCACGMQYQDHELDRMMAHITEKSSPSHKWEYVADLKLTKEMLPKGREER